ncbi:PREDICTED: uncharacterized protein LOC105564088 [Vollenhovia emeryi]|uniref:uncharacterized protein LOC105564088 n=1 Tax=Vollenhovia emeryi TaxID=411798 RepID=UPI0005F3FFE3|nr:PREDICTED: uncharacterized protein LOC105564088 [Vollenhovia emeryi]
MSLKFKCGYCGWILWDKNGTISHGCFKNCKELIMDEDRNLFRKDSLETNVENETYGSGTACIEESITYEKENVPENIEECITHDTERLDEDLISAVKERPALYDFRMPVKERGRKQKDCLWQEVSKCLKGRIYIYIFPYMFIHLRGFTHTHTHIQY